MQYVPDRSPLPPGPRLPAWLQTLLWGVRPLQYAEQCERRFGTPFTMRALNGMQMVQFAAPDDVGAVFALPMPAITVASGELLEPFLGENSLLVLDGRRHHDERRIVVRAFHQESFATQERRMTSCTLDAIERWPVGRAFPIHPAMQALTLEIILRAAFAVDDPARLDPLLGPLREFLVAAGSPLLLLPAIRERRVMRRRWRRFQELRGAIDASLVQLVRERRASDAEGHDILSALATARDEHGELLDERAVRDHLLTLLLAGHDTTATALAWAFDLLAHHPHVTERLARDAQAGSDEYLDAVIREVLRIRPIIPEVARTLAQPATIGGYDLPPGVVAAANIHLAHRRRDTYEDPATFRPERFLDTATEPHAWLPFGGGIRRCIGIAFATLEMRVVLRTVVGARRVEPARARLETPRRRAATLMPAHGAPVVLRTRATLPGLPGERAVRVGTPT